MRVEPGIIARRYTWVPREQGNSVNNTVSGNSCDGANVDAGGGSSRPPLTSREDVPKAALPDNSAAQAQHQKDLQNLANGRRTLAQATATRLPSMSMGELRQQIAAKNKANCN